MNSKDAKMPIFKKRPKTAQQKAQGAQMRILVRVLCCAYIIFYVIIPLIRDVPDESSMSPTIRTIIIAAFIIITAAIIVVTIFEVIRNWKAGLYKATAYTDDGDGNSESEDEENSELGIRNSESEDEDEDDEFSDEYEDEDDEFSDEYEDDNGEYDDEES